MTTMPNEANNFIMSASCRVGSGVVAAAKTTAWAAAMRQTLMARYIFEAFYGPACLLHY